MSSAPAEPRPIPTDARLVWMASERAAPLFRTLDRARAFDPLVVLLVVMPAVVVMFAATCSSWDAAVALLSLDATGVPLPVEARPAVRALVPEDSIRPTALWLAALGLRGIGPSWPLSIMTASLLGGMGLMAGLWGLSKSVAGRRLAFWAVLLAAFHPALIRLLICPVPVSVGLACTVAALWGHLSLGERTPWTTARFATIMAGIAASLLVVGPIAMAGVIVIVLDAALTWLFKPVPRAQTRMPRSARTPGQLLLMRLSAAAAGVVLWFALTGLIPVHHMTAPAGPEPALVEQVGLLNQPEMQIGALWGIAAIGVGRLFRLSYRRGSNRASRTHSRLVLIWLLIALVMLFGFPRLPEAFEPFSRYILAQASIPILIAAAFAIEEAARRAVSGAWLLLAILMPLSMRLGDLMAMISIDSPAIWFFTAVAAISLGWLSLLVFRAIVPISAQRRGLLMAAVLLAIGIDAADGIRLAFHEERRESETAPLMAQLREERAQDGVVLLTSSPPPVSLVFALRGVFADVPMEIAPTWDEAVNHLNRRTREDSTRLLAAAWGLGDAIGAASPGALRPTGHPILFEGRPLLLYVSDPSDIPVAAPAESEPPTVAVEAPIND